jgi:hypothetical protein
MPRKGILLRLSQIAALGSQEVRELATFRRKIPEAGETALRRRIQGGLKNN